MRREVPEEREKELDDLPRFFVRTVCFAGCTSDGGDKRGKARKQKGKIKKQGRKIKRRNRNRTEN